MSGGALRILVTCDWFSPDTGGGAERVVWEITRRLTAAGHRITVLATRPRGHAPFELPPGIDLVTVPAFNLAGVLHTQVSLAPALLVATGRAIEAMQPDVVWSHSLQFQTTPVAAVSARRHRLPFVVTAHIGDLRAVRGPIGVAARVHEATIGRAVLRLSTSAIAVSEAVAAHLRTLAPRLPVDVVPNGVDLRRFRAEEPMPHEGLRVGFLGRLVPNKGPDVAVLAVAEAVRRGVDASLSLAGDGPERGNLERLAAKAGIRARVDFEGFLPAPETWLPGIDVLVRPSTTEGMPLGILEAMAAGVPVVASDVPGNAALLRDGEIGMMVPIGDHLALADALERVDRDPPLRTRMRRAGLSAVTARSWERTTELTEAALRRAISTTRAAGSTIRPIH